MKKMLMVVVCVLVLPALAGADLTIKEATTVKGFMGIWTSKGMETSYIKGDKFRSESEVERSGFVNPPAIKDPPPRIVIYRLDKDLLWRVNLKDETYAEESLTEKAEAKSERIKFKIADIKVESTGETKEIIGRTCSGVKADVTFEVDEGEGAVSETVELLFWMTEDAEGLEEMRAFWDQSVRLSQGRDQDLPLPGVLAKLWEDVEEFKGVPLGMEMAMESPLDEEERARLKESVAEMLKSHPDEKGNVGSEASEEQIKIIREVVSVSDEKLDDSLFEIPEGFKKASRIRIW
jgi:hypothetical protein